jgi:cell division transport system permease protein
MNLIYAIREALSAFRRNKLAVVGSVVTICIALLLLGLYYMVSLNTHRIIQMIRDKVEMEAFCEEPISRQRITELQKQLVAIEGVESARFVSKEEAAKIFREEFGEDIMSVLEFNPLPPSFKIYLKEEYKHTDRAAEVFRRVKNLQGIDDVIYRKDLLEFLDRRMGIVNTVGFGLGTLIGISAIFLVSNTIRLAIYAKRRLIQTMKLVGATRWFIRFPFLLEGILQGVLGGLLASAAIFGLLEVVSRWISSELAEFIKVDMTFYGLVTIVGMFLGLLGSLLSVRRFIGETVVS